MTEEKKTESLLVSGINTPIELPPVTTSPGAFLLLHAAKQSIDYLVSGGYGPPKQLVDIYLECKERYEEGINLTNKQGEELVLQLNHLAFVASVDESVRN